MREEYLTYALTLALRALPYAFMIVLGFSGAHRLSNSESTLARKTKLDEFLPLKGRWLRFALIPMLTVVGLLGIAGLLYAYASSYHWQQNCG